jgi:hypothetical protein
MAANQKRKRDSAAFERDFKKSKKGSLTVARKEVIPQTLATEPENDQKNLGCVLVVQNKQRYYLPSELFPSPAVIKVFKESYDGPNPRFKLAMDEQYYRFSARGTKLKEVKEELAVYVYFGLCFSGSVHLHERTEKVDIKKVEKFLRRTLSEVWEKLGLPGPVFSVCGFGNMHSSFRISANSFVEGTEESVGVTKFAVLSRGFNLANISKASYANRKIEASLIPEECRANDKWKSFKIWEVVQLR